MESACNDDDETKKGLASVLILYAYITSLLSVEVLPYLSLHVHRRRVSTYRTAAYLVLHLLHVLPIMHNIGLVWNNY